MEIQYALIAGFLVSLLSFVGIVLFYKKLTTKSSLMTALIAFAAGALLGDAFIHLLGEHIENVGYEIETILSLLGGIVLMCIVEAILHCSHDVEHELLDNHTESSNIQTAKLSLFGDAVHNFLDGIAIAASFSISVEIGVATTVAVILHEIPQELSDIAILIKAGWSKKRVLLSNFLIALTTLLGVILTFLANEYVEGIETILTPFAAGQFIYIALADLLPVIHKKTGVKKYILEISMFTLGILIMFGLLFIE